MNLTDSYSELLEKYMEVKKLSEGKGLLLTKQECLALVEAYDTAYVSPESTLANQVYRKIYLFATSK